MAPKKYEQKTMRLDPAWIEAIGEMAEQQNISVADAERWLIARGLKAYFSGELMEFAQPERRTVDFPTWAS